ncbi:MAG: tyrosine--tRNA ligase [Candidatus Paceibacterota bacterium]
MKDKTEKIKEIFKRGTEEIIEKRHLEQRLESGKKLRIKFGIDPTANFLHLGHAVCLLKLKEFQKLGHRVIFLIGDFTARIGDPTGRTISRVPLSEKQIKANMGDYIEQAALILDMSKVEIRYNSEWWSKMSVEQMMILAMKLTYSQISARADFQKRLAEDKDFTLEEFMYPVLQGYDSVVLKADVEIGGTDQKFNMLLGRRIQKKYDQEPQDVIMMPLLEGLDGKEKMSKSSNNYIAFTEPPTEMFGKIMSIPDQIMGKYFELLTDISKEEIENLNPRDQKIRLAWEIVNFFHDKKEADNAQKDFIRVFRERKAPDQIKTIKINPRSIGAKELLAKCDLAKSLSEAQRLIEQGAVSLDGQIIKDWRQKISIKKPSVLKAGKHHFVKLIP